MSLERFRIAQADPATGFDVAISELRQGRKVSHWIWYIFPQLRGLGRSSMAQFYGVEGIEEARDYLRDLVLREHLKSAMEVVAAHLSKGILLDTLMGGSVDSLKIVSCVTLFRWVAGRLDEFPEVPDLMAIQKVADDILQAADLQGYPECARTRDPVALDPLGDGTTCPVDSQDDEMARHVWRSTSGGSDHRAKDRIVSSREYSGEPLPLWPRTPEWRVITEARNRSGRSDVRYPWPRSSF